MISKLFVLVISAFLVLTSYGVSYACSSCGCQAGVKDGAMHSHGGTASMAEEAAHKHAVKQVSEANNKLCPVMGNKIQKDKAVKVEYNGKVYNLCCAGCMTAFEKDPEKYIEKMK